MKKYFISSILSSCICFLLGIGICYFINIRKNTKQSFSIKSFYSEEGALESFSFGDNNGLTIIGVYSSDGLETLNIYDEEKDYQQSTSFVKSYDGKINGPEPPKDDEIFELNSFLIRSEVINNKELLYYIENTDDPKIVLQED